MTHTANYETTAQDAVAAERFDSTSGNESNRVNPHPLRKRGNDGFAYTRVSKNEDMLRDLACLQPEQLITRCKIQDKNDSNYVSSECLLHFVRACRSRPVDSYFKQLYTMLADRVLRRLPGGTNAGDKSLSDICIREDTFGAFNELLAKDHVAYLDKLDYYEVRFDDALASLRADIQKKVWRHENRTASLESNLENGELSAEVERAFGSFNPFEGLNTDTDYYQSRLDAAIDALPPLQQRIVQMLRHEFPIHSKDPEVPTIAKTLGKSEKTIRTHRDLAYATLRVTLNQGEVL